MIIIISIAIAGVAFIVWKLDQAGKRIDSALEEANRRGN